MELSWWEMFSLSFSLIVWLYLQITAHRGFFGGRESWNQWGADILHIADKHIDNRNRMIDIKS